MDRAVLDEVRQVGTSATTNGGLRDLAAWCEDHCVETGDARYCLLGDGLSEIDRWRSELDGTGGVPTTLSAIDDLLTAHLGPILDADDPALAARLAASLRDQIAPLLTAPEQWDDTITGNRIVSHLLGTGAVKVDAASWFTFASGLTSPIYVDNRTLVSHVEARRTVIDQMARAVQRLAPQADVVAGVATAGIPWAAWVAEALSLPLLYVRSATKGRGLDRQVEGDPARGATVAVIEDLVTTGGSCVNAVEALRRVGLTPTVSISIFNYGLPEATDALARAGAPLHSLATVDLLADGIERIDPAAADTLRTWNRSLRDGATGDA